MKRAILFLGLLSPSLLKAELPQLVEPKEWMGYFAAWNTKEWDYGFGADGEGILYPKEKQQRRLHDKLYVRFYIQEDQGKRWSKKKSLSWSSEAQGGVGLKKPVSVTLETKDGVKVEVLQTYSKGKLMVKPKFIENAKTDAKPVRFAIEFDLKHQHRINKSEKAAEKYSEKNIKKTLKKDILEARRVKDNKRIKVKMHETEVDILSDKMLAEGATEISAAIGYLKKTMELEQGNPKVGKFEIIKKKDDPLFMGYKVVWSVTAEDSLKKDAWMSFNMKKLR